jgi:peptidoglycan/LPS O-acetylase OafA/YrhL
MNYIKQLDSLRAIAVILVIITHWFPETDKLNIYTSVFNGVDIFFVLSGFLITRILLENRNKAGKEGASRISVIKNFYYRRFLRIFPIYYLTILLLYVAAPITGSDIRNSFFYFLTYTSNYYFFNRQDWDGMLSHFWSLSVEEQFYLIWPWLMLFLKKKFLLPLILTSIFLGIAAQLYLMDVMFGDILTFCCFDGFGLGALVAWVLLFRRSLLKKSYSISLVLAFVGFILQVVRVASQGNTILLPSRTLTSFVTICVIIYIIINREGKSLFFYSILSNRALIFIGKISYSVYLFHLILPYFTGAAFTKLNQYLPSYFYQHNFYLVCFENFCLLILICYASWQIIEKPILKLKRYFEYQKVNS